MKCFMKKLIFTIVTFSLMLSCKTHQDMEAQQKTMVESYIDAYNSFDVERMMQHLDDAPIFENVAGDEVNLHIEGLDAFKKQAKEATQYFSERKQTVESWTFGEEEVQIKISYFADSA